MKKRARQIAYLLYRVALRWRARLLFHLMLLAMLAFGSYLLAVGMNQVMTGQAYIRSLEADLLASPLSIVAAPYDAQHLEERPSVTQAQLASLSLPGLQLHYKLWTRLSFRVHTSEGQESLVLDSYYLSPEIIEVRGLDLQPGKLLIGQAAYENLRKLSRLKPCEGEVLSNCYELYLKPEPLEPLAMEADSLKMDGLSFGYRVLSEAEGQRSLEPIVMKNLPSFPLLRDSLIFHLDDYDEEKLQQRRTRSFLGLRFLDAKTGESELYTLLHALNEGNTDYHFAPTDHYAMLQRAMGDATLVQRRFRFIAQVAMLLLTMGWAALYGLHMRERQREAAIAMAMGSYQQGLELWLEVHVILLLGMGAGGVWAASYQGQLRFQALRVVYHLETVGALALLALFMGTAICLGPLWALARMSPVAILRENA